jgi:hypothetical protein
MGTHGGHGRLGAGITAGVAGLALAAWLSGRRAARGTAPTESVRAARACHRSSALLAGSVLADSALEHERGAYANPAMYLPPLMAALALLAGAHGGGDARPRRHRVRHAVYGGAMATGVAGTGFHLYNILKRPGRWSWHNLFRAAPLGAPMALLLAGGLGLAAERVRHGHARVPRLLGRPAGQALGLLAGAGLLGTTGEAGLLHFRGAFQHRAMYLPVSLPPLAAAALLHAAVTPPARHPLARGLLRLLRALGWLGMAFHARGIARRQGGWRNWSQNLFAGPPLPAPPSFSALAVAGLAALRLRERRA